MSTKRHFQLPDEGRCHRGPRPTIGGKLPPKFARTGGLAFLSDDHLVRSQSMRVRSLCVMLALLAACGKQDPAAPARIETRVRLARAATCESLTRQIQDTAARQMRAQMDEWRSGFAYGLPAAGGAAATPAAGAGPASFSTTNTQVAGVDEADFVKNEGTPILVLRGQTLLP